MIDPGIFDTITSLGDLNLFLNQMAFITSYIYKYCWTYLLTFSVTNVGFIQNVYNWIEKMWTVPDYSKKQLIGQRYSHTHHWMGRDSHRMGEMTCSYVQCEENKLLSKLPWIIIIGYFCCWELMYCLQEPEAKSHPLLKPHINNSS